METLLQSAGIRSRTGAAGTIISLSSTAGKVRRIIGWEEQLMTHKYSMRFLNCQENSRGNKVKT